jgi:hypothetical protein
MNKITNWVQRPILTVFTVTEGRPLKLNPSATKRKKGPVMAHHLFRQVYVAEGMGLAPNALCSLGH